MLKLSPRRNQRSSSRGVKVKHALHICVLGGVCIWLLYQVYHWRNKTATYEEASKKAEAGNRNDFIKLGRKDLDPRIEEMTAEDLKNGGQDAEEGKSFDDDDSNKAVELEQDQEKVEESESLNRHKEEQKGAEHEKAVEEENEVGKGEETEKLSDSKEEKGESNGSEERNENGGIVKGVEVEENNEKRDAMSDGEEMKESKEKATENIVAAAENGTRDSQEDSLAEKGNAETMTMKEQDEPKNSPKNATDHDKNSESGSGSILKSAEVKNGASLGGTGKTSLEDSSNPTEGTIEAKEQQQMEDNSNAMAGIMEAKEQQQVPDKPVTNATQTENGSAGSGDESNAVGGETSLEDNSNPTVGSKEGNEQQQEHDNSITGLIQTENKPVENVDSSGDGKETVPREQTDSSDANSISSSTNGESSSNSTSGEQSSVSAAQTEMTKGLTKQMSGADSGSGEKINPSNDNNKTTNLSENNSTDSSTSQNEDSSSGSTTNPNDGQQNQFESSNSALQEETDVRTDLETIPEFPQKETGGNNHEATE
nr:dentin sialophosphoprotein-like [Ipomoea batatas]